MAYDPESHTDSPIFRTFAGTCRFDRILVDRWCSAHQLSKAEGDLLGINKDFHASFVIAGKDIHYDPR